MQHTKVDTRLPIATPEGTDLTVSVAGPVPRALAWVIDGAIRFAVFMVLGIVFAFFEEFGDMILALSTFALLWLYPSLFEGLRGSTPGKRAQGLLVVKRDGSPCGLEAAFVRNLVRAADFLPLFYGVGLVSMAFSPGYQRLGDRAAGTLVIYDRRRAPKSAGTKARVKKAREGLEPLPPPVALSGEEEASVLAFARRQEVWGEERAAEIATEAAALTGTTGEESRIRLLRMAAWLEGQDR